MYNSEQLFERSQMIVPMLLEYFSQRVLVWILAWIFVAKLVDAESAESSPVARHLFHWGKDVHHFIAISAKTGAINGLFNLVVLAAVGVDFPVLWCVLYFFLSFIPTFGFLIAMVPPTFLALLMLGWKRALLVAGGMILVQMLGDYVITPMFTSKGLNISLLDILLSLMIWGYLLGPAGVVLAVPLTIAVKKIFQQQRGKAQAAAIPAPS
jgi:predicted PurR-regulated permease PerM